MKITFTISMGTLECIASVSVWFRSFEVKKDRGTGFLCFGRVKNDPPPPLLFYLPHFRAVFDSGSSLLASKRTEMLATQATDTQNIISMLIFCIIRF